MRNNFTTKLNIKLIQNSWLMILFSVVYILFLRGGIILCYGWDFPFEQSATDQYWQDRPKYFPEISGEELAKEKENALKRYNALKLEEILVKEKTKSIGPKTSVTVIDMTMDHRIIETELKQERLLALKNEQGKLEELALVEHRMNIQDVRKLQREIRQYSMSIQLKILYYNAMKQSLLIQDIKNLPLEEKLLRLCNYILDEITFKDSCCFHYVEFARDLYKPFGKKDVVYETITSPILLSLWRNDDGNKNFYPEQQLLTILTREILENRPSLNSKYLISIRAYLSLLTIGDNYAKKTHGVLRNLYLYHKECEIQQFLLNNPRCTRIDYYMDNTDHG